MADASELIDSLYTRLILRDLFGKVLPGSLVLVGVYVAFLSSSPSTLTLRSLGEAPFGIWAMLIPLGWLVSFVIQAAGEKLTLIRYYPKSVKTQAEFYRQLVEFANKATAAEQQVHERCVVIKEACGNGYLAIIATVLFVAPRFHQPRAVGLGAVALLAAIGLRWMHRRYVDRQKDWRDAVVNYHIPRDTPGARAESG